MRLKWKTVVAAVDRGTVWSQSQCYRLRHRRRTHPIHHIIRLTKYTPINGYQDRWVIRYSPDTMLLGCRENVIKEVPVIRCVILNTVPPYWGTDRNQNENLRYRSVTRLSRRPCRITTIRRYHRRYRRPYLEMVLLLRDRSNALVILRSRLRLNTGIIRISPKVRWYINCILWSKSWVMSYTCNSYLQQILIFYLSRYSK